MSIKRANQLVSPGGEIASSGEVLRWKQIITDPTTAIELRLLLVAYSANSFGSNEIPSCLQIEIVILANLRTLLTARSAVILLAGAKFLAACGFGE